MNRTLAFLALFALAVAVQPVFMASAGTKLYVEQEGSEEPEGGYKLYNTTPSKGEYTAPLTSGLAMNKTPPKVNAKIPDTWRVLGDDVVQNRIKDTRAALALAAKLRKNLDTPKPWPSAMKTDKEDAPNIGPVTNKSDAKKNQKEVEKDAKKKKKEIDKANKKMAENEEKRKAAEEKMKESSAKDGEEGTEKKKGLKVKKKLSDQQNKRVFNIPE